MLLLFGGDADPRGTFQFLEEKIGIGLWSLDVSSLQMKWSSGFFRLLGFSPDSVEPSLDLFRSMIHPDDNLTLAELRRMLDKGQPIEREFRLIRKDRSIRWVANRGEILMNEAGRPEQAVGVLCDITGRQHAREALLQNEARYRALMKSASAIIGTMSPDGRTVDIPNWSEITGQSATDSQNFGWLAVVHPDDRAAVERACERGFAENVAYNVAYRISRRDGSYQWVDERTVPVTGTDGEIREWVGILIFAPLKPAFSESGGDILTGAQSRAARAILNWSVKDVAEATGISASTIRRLEENDGVSNLQGDLLCRIRKILEQAGVEFLSLPSGAPAVRPQNR